MASSHRLYVGKLFLTLLAVVLFGVLFSAQANAANPSTISFQGKVVNSNGTNVVNGTYNFVFKLYSTASGGSAVWTETDSLTVSGGVFQVNLGAGCPFFTANACNGSTPIDFNANPNLYLGVTFNADPAGEMTPRVQLQSVPFAFNSDKVGGLGVNQLVQLSPVSQQTGTINVSGDITTAANIQGNEVNGVVGINTGASGGTQRIDNSGNLLNIGTITGSSALSVVSGGTAQNISVDASTSGTVKIGSVSTGDIELGGGILSGSGCTLTNSNGNFACSGALTAATGATVGSTTTAGSIVFKDGTGSGNTASITAPVISAPYALTLPGSGPATSQCLRTDSIVASQLVFGSCATIGQKLTQTFNSYSINQGANATTAMNYLMPTTGTAFSIALAGTAEFKATAAGSFRACTLFSSANVTGGSVSIRFRKNGANASATNHCTLSTTAPRSNSEEVASGVETFNAGDTIGVALVSTGLTPATLEHWATFTVEYGAGGVGPTSMQDAYDNGSTVTTADAKNVTFNLSNTATDANYLINVATGSTGRFAVQNNGVDALSVGANGNLLTTGTVNGATITGGTLSTTAVNSLNVSGTAISGSGTGLAISAGGAAQNLTLDGATLGKVVIGSVSTGDIELGGGSASTGCTITNATGALVCSSTINGATISATTFNTATISGGSLTGGAVSGGTLTGTTVNGLNVSGTALSASAATPFTIDANGTQQINIAGISTGDILLGGGSGSTGCTITNATGALACSSTINGAAITSTTFNTATISGGSLTGGSVSAGTVSGGSLSATAVNSLNVSGNAISASTAATFTIDANGTQQVSIAGTSTGDILIGGGTASTGCTITNATGALSCASTINGATINATSFNTATISGGSLTGGAVSGGSLSGTAVNGLNVSSSALTATAAAPFTIDANAAQQISIGGTSTGDVLLGGGSVATGCTVTNSNGNLTCAGAFQAATVTSSGAVNAVTQLQINGANINTAGTLNNVAYLSQANTFSALNTFSAIGTALSVTNNASVGGTLTAGTFSGSGASLTNLNASNLASGTVPNGVVTGSYTGITGTGALAAGSISSTFGVISTASNITTTAAMQGGTVTATGALSGNSLSINGGTFAVSNTGAITASTGATVTGSVSASTSVVTPLLTTSGALTINSGAASNITIDSSAAGAAAINIGGTNATSLGLSRAGQNTTVNGGLIVNQTGTFNGAVSMVFAGTENLAITSDLVGGSNGISYIGTPSATAGTNNGVFVQQANSANANGLDSGLVIDNADTNLAIGSAISITNTGGGGYTNIVVAPSYTLDTNGQVVSRGYDYFDPARLTGATSVGTGGATNGNFGGVASTGAFIDTTDKYGQEFVGSIAAATTNNANAGDDGLWYFNNNNQANITGGNTSTTGGFYRFAAPAISPRGALLTLGSTPGTQDRPILAANLPIIQMKVRTSRVANTADVGFGATNTTVASVTNDALPTSGFVFWTNNSAGATGWQGIVRSGGATIGTPVNCPGVVTANQFATGRIVVVNATTVRFFIDVNASDGVNLVDCGTVTGALPAVDLAPTTYYIQTVATATNVDTDYARYWQDDAAPEDPIAAALLTATQSAQADTTTDPFVIDANTTPPTDTASLPIITGMPSTNSPVTTPEPQQQTFTIDQSTNLNIASATLSGGLSVGGDSTFSGLSTFEKLATFIGKVVFRQNVEFEGHVTVASDSAGYAQLKQGESTVHVTFKQPYETLPIVSASAYDGQFVMVSVTHVTADGFDLTVAEPVAQDTTFTWTAIGVANPVTSKNDPAPAQ